MLIHVEVYTRDWIPGNPPQKQFHASLATSTRDDRLLTIGRKTGDVLLSEDKSVSREHVILRVASTKSRDKTVPASTLEEKAACEEDEYDLCLVLNNVGKLGTYLASEGDKAQTPKGDGDDSSETDATDDEEAVKISQMEQNTITISKATRHLFPGKLIRLKEVSSVTLKTLSKRGGRAVFQCGKMESTIVLTRKMIDVLVSGAEPNGFSQWKEANFYKMGLRQSSRFIVGETSMVVTQARNLVLKQVAAWSLNLPIVNFDYLYSYLDSRKSPSDPLFPLDPKRFAPMSDTNQFWDVIADPQLLSSCTLLSIMENDMECLAEAAGATIKKLYDDGSKTSNEIMIKRAQLILDSTPHCFGLIEKRPKKLDKELQVKAELRLVSSRSLTSAIIEQVLPKDTEGKVVGRLKSQQLSRDEPIATEQGRHVARHVQTDNTIDKGPDLSSTKNSDQMNTTSLGEDESYEKKDPHSTSLIKKNVTLEGRPSPKKTTINLHQNYQPQTNRVKKRNEVGVINVSGWFRAAPKDRSAYKRSREEITAEQKYPLQDVAVTVVCADLIISNTQKFSERRRNDTGPDFRAFRKNRVIATISQPQIVLRSVLPRESEVIQEHEEQEASLAKQRMRADDLFRDPK